MEKLLIVYWSGTGNTEAMAEAISNGAQNAGCEVDLVNVANNPDINNYSKIAFGCPAMGAENLEEGEFEPYFEEVEGNLSDKKVALFGSYGWGDGEWMKSWEDRCKEANCDLFKEGLIVNETPDDEGIELCEEFGKEFANY